MMGQILREIKSQEASLLRLLKMIASISSPTGHERKKIEFVNQKIQSFGLKKVFIDKIGNCIAMLPAKLASKDKKTILTVAHVDTACDPGERGSIKEDKKYIYGHGICDNSAGVIGLLITIELITKYNLKFPHDLIFGFTVGEEGLGAKRGMKQIIKDYGKQIDAVINVESHHIGRVTNQVIGQYRSELSIDTKVGGHSFRDFGRPNANVILAQIISDFSHFKLPQREGKTTFNIGQMKGEGSINAIPQFSSCLFEIRSEINPYLNEAKKKFTSIINKYRKQYPSVDIDVKVLEEVLAVKFPIDHKIYQLTMDVQKHLGIQSKVNSGNTDGDISLAAKIPTVTIGTSEGWNTHSLDEYMEKKSLILGIKQVFMVINKISSEF